MTSIIKAVNNKFCNKVPNHYEIGKSNLFFNKLLTGFFYYARQHYVRKTG